VHDPVIKSLHIPACEMGHDRMNQEKTNISTANREIIAPPVTNQANFAALKDPEFDARSLWDRVNGDMELLRDLLEILKTQAPELLWEMKTALERNAAEDLRRVSHKMKGSALQFSAPEAAALAGTLEDMGKRETLEGAQEVLLKLESQIRALINKLTLRVNGATSP
jgi:HPt (histidine-containing phosphotransfer) domain-containing protein